MLVYPLPPTTNSNTSNILNVDRLTEIVSGYATAIGFIAYTIALLVMAPKASARSVFVDLNNETGYVPFIFKVLVDKD